MNTPELWDPESEALTRELARRGIQSIPKPMGEPSPDVLPPAGTAPAPSCASRSRSPIDWRALGLSLIVVLAVATFAAAIVMLLGWAAATSGIPAYMLAHAFVLVVGFVATLYLYVIAR